MLAHQDMVFSTAVRILGSEAEAEDISQEVFLRAFDHYSELANSATAGGWLRTVARNLSLNYLARYRFRWRFFSEMREEDHDLDFVSGVPAAETGVPQAIDRDRWQFLEKALKQLPKNQRIPLVLYHFEDMSYEAIAKQLGVSLSKIKTDIHRARLNLTRLLRHKISPNGEWLETLDDSYVAPCKLRPSTHECAAYG